MEKSRADRWIVFSDDILQLLEAQTSLAEADLRGLVAALITVIKSSQMEYARCSKSPQELFIAKPKAPKA